MINQIITINEKASIFEIHNLQITLFNKKEEENNLKKGLFISLFKIYKILTRKWTNLMFFYMSDIE